MYSAVGPYRPIKLFRGKANLSKAIELELKPKSYTAPALYNVRVYFSRHRPVMSTRTQTHPMTWYQSGTHL